MRIRTGDTVEVISGDHKGERGEVQRVLRGRRGGRHAGPDANKDRLVVAGVNLITKHQGRTGNIRTQTGRIEREAPLHVSNVLLVCRSCDQASRVGMKILEDGSKARYCKKCGSYFD